MAVGGISQFINPVIDSIIVDGRSTEARTFNAPTKDVVKLKVLAIGDENCQKDQLLLRCAYSSYDLDVQERAILKRAKYSDISLYTNIQRAVQNRTLGYLVGWNSCCPQKVVSSFSLACEAIYNRLRYQAYNTVDCVALCYQMVKGSSFSSMCDSWISEVRYVSRSIPIVSVRIINENQECIYNDQEIEQHWKDALKKGCKYHVDCHLDRPFEVETFLNMLSVAGLHKLGYTYQDGKIIRKGHRLINSVFRLTTTLRIPLPIPFLKQKELRSVSLNYENKSENFAAILNDKSSADVVFICKENRYYCHKIILCSRIHLFRELFGVCIDHDSTSVKCISEIMSLNVEVLNVTSLFEDTNVVQSSHHCNGITQIKVKDQVSPIVFDMLIKCVYNHSVIIDKNNNNYSAIVSYGAELGILAYGDRLQSDIDYLQMFYYSSVFSDLTLIINNEKLSVHKAVLCARSNVFSAMFSGHYKEGSQLEVVLPNCDNAIYFKMFLDWIYFGRSDSVDALMAKGFNGETTEPILSLLKLGDEYCIEDLIRYAEAKFSELLSRHLFAEYLDELPGVLDMCEMFNASILKNWVVKAIANYFYKQYDNPEVKSCFAEQHQQAIEKFKPYHLSLVGKLKAFYLTL